jgi:hypothetical protein
MFIFPTNILPVEISVLIADFVKGQNSYLQKLIESTIKAKLDFITDFQQRFPTTGTMNGASIIFTVTWATVSISFTPIAME